MTSLKRYLHIVLIFFICQFPKHISAQTASDKKDTETITKIKSAFIYNFTKYVYWPHEDQMETFKICVLNCPAISKYLNVIAESKKFRNRLPIEVIICRSVSDIRPCQMLLIDGSGKENLWSAYSKIRGKGTLMIAENLPDYKKSMVSFTEVDGKIKYIVNKTKMDEGNLVTNELFYTMGITKEGEWNSIFEKFDAMLNSKNKEVTLDKSDISQMMNLYNTLQHDNKAKSAAITLMEDSIRRKIEEYNHQIEEYNKMSERIDEQKRILAEQDALMRSQKSTIFSQVSLIGQQKTVITTIAALSAFVFILLIIAVRSIYLRNKANKLLAQQKNEIAHQKHLVDEKHKEIKDSISYAERIQRAMLASKKLLDANLKDYFVFYKPKDIVSGDFYWANRLPNNKFVLATADSTGHGVPGAIMSMLNMNSLKETVSKEIFQPAEILNYTRQLIISTLANDGSAEGGKDGMDCSLCLYDFTNMKLYVSAANNPVWIVRTGGKVLEIKPDKMPIGKHDNQHIPFTQHEIELQKDDVVFTLTDGFPDQFGGENNKKFMSKNLRKLLALNAHLPMIEQKQILEKTFTDWVGVNEQVDDVTIIGVRV